MKFLIILLLFIFAATATPVQADSLTVPNKFTAGTPAIAAEVNANFDAVKSSVDDNDTRITNNAINISNNTTTITNLETVKQNQVTGVCSSGYAIRAINSDGSVICEFDNDSGGDITGVTAGSGLFGGGTSGSISLRLANGAASVHASAMVAYTNVSNNCESSVNYGTYFSYSTTSTYANCNSFASIQLPQGATLTGLNCLVYDNDPLGFSYVKLMRVSSNTASIEDIYQTSSSTDTGYQNLTDSTSSISTQVNNYLYNYVLMWYSAGHNTTTVGHNARFYNCTVIYVYP